MVLLERASLNPWASDISWVYWREYFTLLQISVTSMIVGQSQNSLKVNMVLFEQPNKHDDADTAQ
jgi:hypothetical protein